MDATRPPETMTTSERRDEVVAILAEGMLRVIRQRRGAGAESAKPSAKVSELSPKGLDLSPDSPLSVAQRPAG